MKLHRWVIAVLPATAVMLFSAGSAQAASPTSTLPAEYVTAASALLRGTVDTGGQRTIWAFQYGPSTRYGQTTAARTIPAGHGRVTVSLKIAGLQKRTHYHFRFLAQYGQGSVLYPIFVNFGGDRGFVTRPQGNFGLGPTTLVFPGRYAPVSLYCAGSLRCAGTLTITSIKPGHPKSVLTLGRRTFVIKGHQYNTFRVRLSAAALALLKRSGGQTTATLTVKPSIGRATLTRDITLVR